MNCCESRSETDPAVRVKRLNLGPDYMRRAGPVERLHGKFSARFAEISVSTVRDPGKPGLKFSI